MDAIMDMLTKSRGKIDTLREKGTGLTLFLVQESHTQCITAYILVLFFLQDMVMHNVYVYTGTVYMYIYMCIDGYVYITRK